MKTLTSLMLAAFCFFWLGTGHGAHIGVVVNKVTKCVDAGSKEPADGTKVTLQPCKVSDDQNFHVDGGNVRIKGTRKCLDIGPEEALGTQKFALVVVKACNAKAPTQYWTIKSHFLNDGVPKKCLAALGEFKDGAHVGLAACSTSPNQKFGLD